MPQEEKRNRVDLDVVDDIRRELAGGQEPEPPEIVYKGETFLLEVDLPLDAIEVQAEISELLERIDEIERDRGQRAANIEAAKLGRLYIRLGEAMLGDEWERFRKHRPGLGILAELAASLGTLYPALPEELDSGEGKASGGSSGRGSGRSRPSSRKRTRR
jgi:hypothetical protein